MNECIKCSFETRTYAKLIIHYKFVHSHENDFQLTCSIDGCLRTYRNICSFLKHVKRNHKTFHDNHFYRWRHLNVDPNLTESFHHVHENDDDNNDIQVAQNAGADEQMQDIPQTEVDYIRKVALFLLSLRENSKLPSNAITKVITEVTDMLCYHQSEISGRVLSFLRDIAVTEQQLEQCSTLLMEQTQIGSACLFLNSEYKLNKYVRENFGFIAPIQYDLSRNSKDGKFQYIPIFKTLQNLLNHNDVFSYVINSHQSEDNILRDICDGLLFRNNELFGSDPTALQIMLYFDEFTASNPIGNKVKNFKIGAFYMLLGNLPPKYRSQLYTIQLVTLCMSSAIKIHGFHAVLEPLIYDLKLLETEGITILKDSGEYKFYGSVCCVISDNLGAHGIGGFLESFSCLRNCRFCFVTKDNMQRMFECDDFNLRTPQMHSAQLRNLEQDSSLSSVYGIKADSPLNDLEFYHVTKGLPSDLAHDLFEGVVCYVLSNTIESLVRADLFSLDELNTSILNFKWDATDVSNKPVTVPKTLRNFNIKQTAAQIWCLARFLPLIIGDKVNRGNVAWETFLLMRDMIFFVCSPEIDKGEVLLMKDIIEDFHESYRQNYPNDSVKPKFHYTLHYPMETLKFGPLVHLQTIRFEGKHNYFKELVYRTKNKMNICKSLALRHQYYQCTFNASENYLFSLQPETSDGSTIPLCLLRNEYQRLLSDVLHGVTDVYLSNTVSMNSIKYFKGCCVIRNLVGDLFYFSRVQQCVAANGHIFLLCTKMRTVNFDRHFHAFIVRETEECDCIDLKNLKDPHPYGLYPCPVVHNSFFVVMKYNVLFN